MMELGGIRTHDTRYYHHENNNFTSMRNDWTLFSFTGPLSRYISLHRWNMGIYIDRTHASWRRWHPYDDTFISGPDEARVDLRYMRQSRLLVQMFYESEYV